MINVKSIEEAKKLAKEEKRPIIIRAQSDDFNRKALEQVKFDILLSPESENKQGGTRQIDSGLNEVLLNIAKKRDITIGIDLKEIKDLEKIDKARRLAKLRQNIVLCKRIGVKIKMLNYKNKREASSFLTSLGASTKQAQEAA